MFNYILAAIAFKGLIYIVAAVAQFFMVVAVVLKGVKEGRAAKCIVWLGASCVVAGLTLLFMGVSDLIHVYYELQSMGVQEWTV